MLITLFKSYIGHRIFANIVPAPPATMMTGVAGSRGSLKSLSHTYAVVVNEAGSLLIDNILMMQSHIIKPIMLGHSIANNTRHITDLAPSPCRYQTMSLLC